MASDGYPLSRGTYDPSPRRADGPTTARTNGDYRYRALDQPVCGMHRRDDRTTLFVQREVPGIYGEDQDCCHKPITRLEAVDVTQWVSHKE